MTIIVITFLGSLTSFAEAKLGTPFDYQTTGVKIIDYELDFKDIEIILDVQAESSGFIEISFARSFFDSTFQGNDEEFTILADGDLVYYNEIQNSPEIRTLKFNIQPHTELVEIFGSDLMGLSKQSKPVLQVDEVSGIIKEDKIGKINQLLDENKKIRDENQLLREENQRLDNRIFELENLVSALEIQVNNLNAIVTEQVKVIYNWVLANID